MPIYRFHCPKCDKHFERIMKVVELETDGPPPCYECKEVNTTRAFTAHATYNIKGDNSASVRPKRA